MPRHPDISIVKTEMDIERCNELLDLLGECTLDKSLTALHAAYYLTLDAGEEYGAGRQIFLDKINLLQAFIPAWQVAMARRKAAKDCKEMPDAF